MRFPFNIRRVCEDVCFTLSVALNVKSSTNLLSSALKSFKSVKKKLQRFCQQSG